MTSSRIVVLAAVLLAPPASVAAQPVADGHVSLGMQMGTDVVFDDPVFMAQTGPIAHVRFDAQHSMRVLAAYAYAPNLNRGYVSPELPLPAEGETPSTEPAWRDRHMFSLRLSEGFSFDPAIEGRLFGEVRFVAVRRDGGPPGGIDVSTSEDPILVPDGVPDSWRSDWSIGGGTEWIVRPESSRRLELGVSLGVAAVAYDTYDPRGRARTGWSSRVHGGLSVGWLFF